MSWLFFNTPDLWSNNGGPMKSAFIALTLALLIACESDGFRGTSLSDDMPTTDFLLQDQDGRDFRLSAQQGKVVLLFFGFTYCPDVCPTTLSNWKRVEELLAEKSEQVKFVYITVDPERDTPEKLARHLKIFSDNFVGLTGPTESLQEVYDGYGILRERVEISDSASGYLINHSARINLIDPKGRWRLTYANDTPPADIANDIRILLAEGASPAS
jgi:protein SCO1/2